MLLTAPTWSNSAIAQGTLRVAFGSSLNTLDPAKTKIGEEYIQNFLIFSGLTEIDRDGKLKPDLAESWTASDDVKTWTFNIRKGVKFHHGREVDAEDVKATIERVIDKAIGSVTRVNFEIIERMEIARQAHHQLQAEDPPMPALPISSATARHASCRATRSIRSATEPIGTGPFRFKSFRPGDRVELVKNPDYFVPGTPKLDAIVFRIMPESAAQVAALDTGDVDLVWNLPLEAIQQFKENANVTVDSVADLDLGRGHHERRPQAVRRPYGAQRAVALAMDKKALVEAALVRPRHADAYDDPADAPLLQQGHRRSQDPTSPAPRSCSPRPGIRTASRRRSTCRAVDRRASESGIAVKELLKPLGIDVDVQRVPWDKFVKDIEGKDAFFVDGFYSRPTIDTSIYPVVSQRGIVEYGALELQERRPWTRFWTRRAAPSPTKSGPSSTRSSRCLAAESRRAWFPT